MTLVPTRGAGTRKLAAVLGLMAASAVAGCTSSARSHTASRPAGPSHSTVSTVTASAAAAPKPLLGLPWTTFQKGFGTVAPTVVFNGGDPSGYFRIHWLDWGDSTAQGRGQALWTGDGTVADGTYEPADFEAFDLGTCKGRSVYLHLAVWFPQHHQKFDPRNNGEVGYLLCPQQT